MSQSEEIERKYDIDDEAVLPEIPGFAALTRDPARLVAIYYDTADRALARRATALRRREGGHDAGWHLKSPGAIGRIERQAPLADALPAELEEVIRPIVGDAELEEIARIETVRIAVELRDAVGDPVVELADDRVRTTDAATGTQREWREWEAELLPAAPTDAVARDALLDAVEEALAASGARPPLSGSKLARALGFTSLGAEPPRLP